MTAAAAVATTPGAESAWSKLKGHLLDSTTDVYGLKNHQWKPETWWWNEEVDKAIQEKHARIKVKIAYVDARRVWQNMPSGWLSLRQKRGIRHSRPGDGVFRIAKQMNRRNQGIVGENCVSNDAGELALTDKDNRKAWV